MSPDYAPERLADKMTAEQELKQFVIRDPAPLTEIFFMMFWLVLLYAAVVNADKIDAFLLWVGL